MNRYVFGSAGTHAPADWDSRGGGMGGVVASLLASLGFSNVFTSPPSAMLCADPIVVTCGSWRRASSQVDGCERGVRTVDVLVCCDDPGDAEATACSVERDLRLADWAGKGTGWHARVVSADTTAPAPRGRDGSGRWLWGFSVDLTIVRDFDE